MKKTLLAAVAALAIAGTANAAPSSYATQTYGQDAQAWWLLNSTVDTFCKLGAQGGTVTGLTNASGQFGANGQGGTVAEADGTITFDIQNDTNNTIKAAAATVSVPFSQCNRRFDITVNSLNGGLRNSANTTTDTDFTNDVDYDVAINFDGVTGNAQNVAAGTTPVVPATQATAGTFSFTVDVDADTSKLLLQGTYSDFLKVVMAPVA
jgi:hypothetical protein